MRSDLISIRRMIGIKNLSSQMLFKKGSLSYRVFGADYGYVYFEKGVNKVGWVVFWKKNELN